MQNDGATRHLHAISRRALLKALAGTGAAAIGAGLWARQAMAQQLLGERPQAAFTGPGANPYWNSPGPIVTYPQKDPLILLTDRTVQLETPRHYFLEPFTPNSAFYVRWHLDQIPNRVDLAAWRMSIEGQVARPLKFSFSDLISAFPPVTLAAVNQCSGNSRGVFQPRVAGGQWGNGAMGNAKWTGVRLRELLDRAKIKPGSVALQLQGLELGSGPEGRPSHEFRKSLDLDNPVLDECIVAYAMNGEPLPFLNGFPVRLVVPGYFATYWTKGLSWLRVLDKPDENFWMKTAYRVPDTLRGNTTPAEVKAGTVKMVPIGRMPVRSFLIAPDGSAKLPANLPVELRGIAFSGHGGITRAEVSVDDGKTWRQAKLGEDYGSYSFRVWKLLWTPKQPGKYVVAVRATDGKGNVQPDDGVWNPGGYLWNRIERQEIFVGRAR